MAEAILFPLSGKLISFLASEALNQISLSLYAKNELKELKIRITTIRNVLLDAQEQQNSKHAIKEWLRSLKIILQEADDLFDEVATEASRQDIIINKSTTRKVFNFFTSSYIAVFHHSLGRKIKDIRERLDKICADVRDFGFLVQTLDKSIIKKNINDKDPKETTSQVNAQSIFGREDDKKRLLKKILSPIDDENVHVIPIVGMGGLGKTTLAQMIFDDNALENQFDIKLWVFVSDDFDVKRILTAILKGAGEHVVNFEMEELQILFREKFSVKRFFLVLDDVWNDDLVKWKKLENLLMTGARGSRVLVTSRDRKVADIVRTVDAYVLKGIPQKDCLSILVKWAFKTREETKHPGLIEIGQEIVKKCSGVPLAARTLGVLLFSKTSRNEWLLVRDSEIWAQEQNEKSIISILKLSYDQMPSSLKECFGYCSIFEKGKLISKEQLMYQWMAHVLIQSADKNVELEDVCEFYFEELRRRSFLEEVDKAYWDKACVHVFYKMHDLVHDLAQFVADGKNLIVNDTSKTEKSLMEKKNSTTIMMREHCSSAFKEAIISCRRLSGTEISIMIYPEQVTIAKV